MAWQVADSQSMRRIGMEYIALSEEDLNDSDKSLVYTTDVGRGSKMLVASIRIEFAASATVGSRALAIQVLDSGSDVIRALELVTTVAASETKNFEMAPGLDQVAGSIVNYEQLPSDFYLMHGQSMRIYDSASIDGAADDMTLHVTGIIT